MNLAVNNPTPGRRCFCSRKPRPFRIGLHEQNRFHMFLFVFFLVIEAAAAAALSQPAEAVSQLWPQQFNAATSLHVAHAAASLADDGIIRIANALSLQSSVNLLEHVNSALPEALAASADTAAFEVDDVYVSYFGDVLRRDSEDGIRRRHDLKLAISRPPVADAVDELLATLGPTIAECLGPDAVLHECAALISDPQAPQQPFHPDTPYRSEQGLAVLTSFIALQPVDESMGPTKFVPQSHTAAAHEAFNSAETKLAMLLRRPTWRGVLDTGEATLFDSRLIHCGGANESPRRRVLFYISFRAKEASAPPGTLLYDLRGRYSLSRSKSDGVSWALQDSHGATHWCHGEPSNRPDRMGAEP